jgi:RNA polymerase sigma factor (sigma-70 family)
VPRPTPTRPSRTRPARADIDPAARDLIERRGTEILATARRYAATPEDAEDAYQRGLEILLTKAPTTDEEELLPWLKTVVKHEAFAIRKQGERAARAIDGAHLEAAAGTVSSGHDELERYERLRLGAEALHRLKPQEVRALALKAQGYSYQQICDETGWTFTKVNRCLTEGRRRFVERVAGIESGAECERLAPLLSALADGEASAADMATLRLHLRSCLSCKATLREYRAVPRKVAAMLPVPALVPGALDALVAWIQDHLTAVLGKLQQAAHHAGLQKAAAVAGSTAAVAGGAVGVQTLDGPSPDRPSTTPAAKAPAPPRSHARPASSAGSVSTTAPRRAARRRAPARSSKRGAADRPSRRSGAARERDPEFGPPGTPGGAGSDPTPATAGEAPADAPTAAPPAPASGGRGTTEFAP